MSKTLTMTMRLTLNASISSVLLLSLAACTTVAPSTVATERASPLPTVEVYAAGSLRQALTQIAKAYEVKTGQAVALTFGASGLLRERIEKAQGVDSAAQVFASADTDHPARLSRLGGWREPTVFVRNQLCALTQGNLNVSSVTLLDVMLQPGVRLATSTPKADPSGDYAWALFRRAENVQTGAYERLSAKALQLTGGADSVQPPAGRSVYAWLMERNQADLFLIYCTNASAAQQEVASLKVVAVPVALQVGAAYGLTVRRDAPANAVAFAQALTARDAQAIFRNFGFGAP